MDFRMVPGTLERIRLAFAFLFMAGGLGVCGLYGAAWLELPHYNDEQIAAMAQVQAVNAIVRNPKLAPQDSAAAEKLLAQARAHVEKGLEKRRKNLMAGLVAGFLLLIAGFWQWHRSRS